MAYDVVREASALAAGEMDTAREAVRLREIRKAAEAGHENPEDYVRMKNEAFELCQSFARAMHAKMLKSARKPGRGDAWKTIDPAYAAAEIVAHVDKGDMIDVALLAAFKWNAEGRK